MSDNLKKCPFCGSQNIIVSNWGMWRCWCADCKAKSEDGIYKKDAIEAWNRRTDNRWISVEDGLPEERKRVLILIDTGTVFCGEIRLRELLPEWWYYYDPQSEDMDMLSVVCWSGRLNPVTHWMPLPETPKED